MEDHKIEVPLDGIGWWRDDFPLDGGDWPALDGDLRAAVGPEWRLLYFGINRKRHAAICYVVPASPGEEA